MTAAWAATVLTLDPEMFPGPLGVSLSGDALGARPVVARDGEHPRAWARPPPRASTTRRRAADRAWCMRCDVLAAALDAAAPADDARPRLLMSPRGTRLTQARVRALAAGPGVVVGCGRFEGVDERVIDGRGLEEVSIGDYVLSGGEIAAMALIDACVRLLPGVMGRMRPAPRRASRPAFSNTRTTRGPASGRGARSRTCSSPAITPPSRGGAGPR